MSAKLIFTNGCFDVLHKAHVELLQFAKSLGNHLIVGLNSDASVKKVKGKNRPINCQVDRKLILESIRYVDEVVIFDDETPWNLIKTINPDIIVKGGDYSPSEVVGNDLCEIVIFNWIDGYSTTKAIQDLTDR